jgi:ribosomal protein S30
MQPLAWGKTFISSKQEADLPKMAMQKAGKKRKENAKNEASSDTNYMPVCRSVFKYRQCFRLFILHLKI